MQQATHVFAQSGKKSDGSIHTIDGSITIHIVDAVLPGIKANSSYDYVMIKKIYVVILPTGSKNRMT
jgi:hypothetical protein